MTRSETAEPALVAESVGVRRGSHTVVSGFDLRADSGIVALAGPNGAGKTTILRCFATLIQPSEGAVRVCGVSTESRRGRRAALSKLGYLPQEADFPRHFTGRQAVEYGAWLRGIPRRDRDEAAVDAMERFGASQLSDRRLSQMSTGERQRVMMAQATVHAPRILLLDEPTAAMDPEQRAVIRRQLRRWSTNRLVIVATHLIEELELLSDRLLVMMSGHVVFDGTYKRLVDFGSEAPQADEREAEAALRILRALAEQ